MNTATAGIIISPVSMENRRELGIKAGDTVRVHQKIQDKDKTRIQVFEGLVLTRKHGNEPGATFTVRKVVDGIGVEKIFPLYSPMIDKIEITKRSKVRRAKLYYVREKVAREIKRQMRRMRLVELSSISEAEATARAEEKAAQAETEAKAEETTNATEITETTETDMQPEVVVDETKEGKSEGTQSEEKKQAVREEQKAKEEKKN